MRDHDYLTHVDQSVERIGYVADLLLRPLWFAAIAGAALILVTSLPRAIQSVSEGHAPHCNVAACEMPIWRLGPDP